MPTQTLHKLRTTYTALANSMKERGFHIIVSQKEQKRVGLTETIFIPFDSSETDDTNGFGIYLFVHEIHTPAKISHCLVAATTLQLASAHHKKEISLLLHEINLHLPIPGWIFNDADNLLHFKYVFSEFGSDQQSFDAYLTIIAEIVNGIAKSFPIIKDVIEGKSFKDIRDEVAGRLA